MPENILDELSPTDNVDMHKLGSKEIDAFRQLRWKARTDLLFLAREVLKKDRISREFNGPLIDKLQKFPSPTLESSKTLDRWTSDGWIYKPVIEHPANLPGKRRRLIVDFRSSYKTTLNCECHTIQWLINYPTACLALFQYNLEKAQSIVKAVKDHFLTNGLFRALFPELCPPPNTSKFGNMDRFSVHNVSRWRKTPRREDSVMAAALMAGLAGYHFEVMKFSDVVDTENSENEDQCIKTIHKFGQSKYLLVDPSLHFMDVEGTRYHHCFQGDTRVTMSDWTQKPIKDIVEGDTVVGWKLENNARVLAPVKVLATGYYDDEFCNTYYLESGEKVTCTPDHKFWRGKQWKKNSKNKEYSPIKGLSSLRRLLVPKEQLNTHDAGWLAGMYDGEGSWHQNPNHPSGQLFITQTQHNPDVVERLRTTISKFGYKFVEKITKPKVAHWQIKHDFHIANWIDRYEFLAEIRPTRTKKMIKSLFGQMFTTQDNILRHEYAGQHRVYWIQTESGNYIAEGLCSANSDLYGKIIEDHKLDLADVGGDEEKAAWDIYCRGIFKVRKNDADMKFTPDELELPPILGPDGKRIPWDVPSEPKRFPLQGLEREERIDPANFSAQMRNVPFSGRSGVSDFILATNVDGKKDLPTKNVIPGKAYDKIPMSYTIVSVDPAETTTERSNHTAICVATLDRHGRVYIKDIIIGKWNPTDVGRQILDACDKHLPEYLCLEEVSATRNLLPYIAREWDLGYKHHRPTVKFNKRDTKLKKEEKIRLNLHSPFEIGDLRFVSDRIDPVGFNHLILELSQFPKGGKDDILDALSEIYAARTWFGQEFARPQKPGEFQLYHPDAKFVQMYQEAAFKAEFDGEELFPDPRATKDVFSPTISPQQLNDYWKKVGGL